MRVGLCVVVVMACSSSSSSESVGDTPSTPAGLSPSVSYGGITVRTGDRVRVTTLAGRVDSIDSGHPTPVALGPGTLGTVLGGRRIDNATYKLTYDVAVVRWDAQTWHEHVSSLELMEQGKPYSAAQLADLHRATATVGPRVELPSFVSTVSPAYLEVVR